MSNSARLKDLLARERTLASVGEGGCNGRHLVSVGLDRATLKVELESLYQVSVVGECASFAHHVPQTEISIRRLPLRKIDRVVERNLSSTAQT